MNNTRAKKRRSVLPGGTSDSEPLLPLPRPRQGHRAFQAVADPHKTCPVARERLEHPVVPDASSYAGVITLKGHWASLVLAGEKTWGIQCQRYDKWVGKRVPQVSRRFTSWYNCLHVDVFFLLL